MATCLFWTLKNNIGIHHRHNIDAPLLNCSVTSASTVYISSTNNISIISHFITISRRLRKAASRACKLHTMKNC